MSNEVLPPNPRAAPPAPPPARMSAQECVVYVAAIAAATVIALAQPVHALWCLGLVAVLGGVKLADILSAKRGGGPPTSLGLMAITTFSLLTLVV